jgi:hypothetical protein
MRLDPIVFFLVAAAGTAGGSTIDRIRLGNAAARVGAPDAERHYAAAEERTNDPGLLAFNRGAYFFARGDYREAERQYLRCLDDSAIPAERRRRALHDRAVCLIHRDGDTRIFRAAIQSLEDCLAESNLEPDLAESARENLELAKVMWHRERSRQKEPPTPNERNPDEQDPPVNPMVEPGSEQSGDRSTQSAAANATTTGRTQDSNTQKLATGTEQKGPGTGPLPVVKDDSTVQRLSPHDTRALLEKTAARLRSARRQNELLRAGPERPNVRDW